MQHTEELSIAPTGHGIRWIWQLCVRCAIALWTFFVENSWRHMQRDAEQRRRARSPALARYERWMAATIAQRDAQEFIKKYEDWQPPTTVVEPQWWPSFGPDEPTPLESNPLWREANREKYEEARRVRDRRIPRRPEEDVSCYDEDDTGAIMANVQCEFWDGPDVSMASWLSMHIAFVIALVVVLIPSTHVPMDTIRRVSDLLGAPSWSPLPSMLGEFASLLLWNFGDFLVSTILRISVLWFLTVAWMHLDGWEYGGSYASLRPIARLWTYVWRDYRFERWTHREESNAAAVLLTHLHLQIVWFTLMFPALAVVLIWKMAWPHLPDFPSAGQEWMEDVVEAYPYVLLGIALAVYVALRVIIARKRRARAEARASSVRASGSVAQRIVFLGILFGRKIIAFLFFAVIAIASIALLFLLCFFAVGIVVTIAAAMGAMGYAAGMALKVGLAFMVSCVACAIVVGVPMFFAVYFGSLLCVLVVGSGVKIAPFFWRCVRVVFGPPHHSWEQ